MREALPSSLLLLFDALRRYAPSNCQIIHSQSKRGQSFPPNWMAYNLLMAKSICGLYWPIILRHSFQSMERPRLQKKNKKCNISSSGSFCWSSPRVHCCGFRFVGCATSGIGQKKAKRRFQPVVSSPISAAAPPSDLE